MPLDRGLGSAALLFASEPSAVCSRRITSATLLGGSSCSPTTVHFSTRPAPDALLRSPRRHRRRPARTGGVQAGAPSSGAAATGGRPHRAGTGLEHDRRRPQHHLLRRLAVQVPGAPGQSRQAGLLPPGRRRLLRRPHLRPGRRPDLHRQSRRARPGALRRHLRVRPPRQPVRRLERRVRAVLHR